MLPRGEHGAGDRREFAAAQGCGHRQRIAENAAMEMQRGLDRRALARQPVVVDAGAAAGPARRAAAEQGRAQRCRRRRVRDAHLADRQQVAIVGHGAISGVDRFEILVGAHRRGLGEIARRTFEFDRHDAKLGGSGLGDLVDGRTACGKIRHHLRGDGLRIGRDAARGDAVIAGEDGDGDALQKRLLAALPLRQPDREFFEAAEAARRLCQILLPLCGHVSESPIAAGQVATEGADVV